MSNYTVSARRTASVRNRPESLSDFPQNQRSTSPEWPQHSDTFFAKPRDFHPQ